MILLFLARALGLTYEIKSPATKSRLLSNGTKVSVLDDQYLCLYTHYY
jgi:hypothetical protein